MITRRECLKQGAMAGGGLALMGAGTLRALARPGEQAQLAGGADVDAQIAGKGSLKAHAHKHGLLAGSAVAAGPLRNEEDYSSTLAEQYSLVVGENCMKFGPLRPTPDSYFFVDADALVAFAEQHKMKVRGHNFVWHEELPTWFKSTVTKENAKKILTDHIMTVAGRYKGKIQSWDVVNEAINVNDGRPDGLRKTPWFEMIGPDYLELAYKTARQADPHAKLTYNEYGIEYDNEDCDRKRAATLALLKRLKAAGAPVDALGIQSHIQAVSSSTFGKGLRELIDAAHGMRLEVYVTEMDVNDAGIESDDPAERDRIVAGVYRDYLSAVLEHKAVKSVLTWGFTDKHTWLNGMRRRQGRPNRPERPLPFDADYKPAPAFFAIREAFDKAPGRKAAG